MLQCPPEEDEGRRQVTAAAQVRSDRPSPLVYSAVQVHPPALHLYIGLVGSPRATDNEPERIPSANRG